MLSHPEKDPMTDTDTYNGWTNYPTWAVNLWLSNDRGLNDQALEIAAEEYDDARESLVAKDGTWTLDEARRFNLADHYRDWVEEMHADEDISASLGTDLLDWALAQVNWTEIAEGWLITLEETRAYA